MYFIQIKVLEERFGEVACDIILRNIQRIHRRVVLNLILGLIKFLKESEEKFCRVKNFSYLCSTQRNEEMNRLIKEQNFCNLANQVANGRLESVVYFEECKMLKGGRANSNPFLGRVMKSVKVTGIQFGVAYNHLTGVVSGGYGNNGLNGCEWVKYPVIIRSLSQDASKYGKLQLRCTLTNSTKFVTTYYLDGKLATDREVAEIGKWLSKTSISTIFNITIEKIAEWRINGQVFADNDLLTTMAQHRMAI